MIKVNHRLSVAALAAAGLGVITSPTLAAPEFFTDFNLVVTSNLQNNSQDVEGRTYVGGNLSGGSPTMAKNLTPAANFVGIDTLVVGGNTSVGNINLQSGDYRRGGTRSGNLNKNGVNQQEIVDANLASRTANLASQMASTSAYLQGLAANSSVTLPSGGQPGAVKYNLAPVGGTAVFNVLASDVFNSNLIQQIELLGSATTIIVNVAGTTVNFNTGNFVGNWLNSGVRASTIWNFYQATSINLDRNFNGAILAPLAHLQNSTAIDGSVFVKSFTQTGEVHLPNFSQTNSIPVPGAAGVLALSGLVVMRRRRV